MPRNPATLLDLMSVELADLQADAVNTLSKITIPSDDDNHTLRGTDMLLERAKAVDAGLASWPVILPSHWHPVRVFKDTIPQEVIDAGIYGEYCEIYPDIMICSTWNDWRVARLKGLRLISVLRERRDEIDTFINDEIQELVDGICASIPFCLGSRTEPAPLYEAEVVYPGLKGRMISKEHQKAARAYGGWYLFSPFKETMELGRYISKDQHDWLRSQLYRLARIYDVTPD